MYFNSFTSFVIHVMSLVTYMFAMYLVSIVDKSIVGYHLLV